MKKIVKDKIKKIAAFFLAAAVLICLLPEAVYASGSFSISKSSITVTQGSSSSFTFTATNAVGAFSISTDGGVSASCSSSELWVDCSSVTITVTGNTVGTGHVYISVYDGADYDGNDLSGKSFTVTVTVTSASGGTNEVTTTVSSTEATTKATTASTTTEETTVDPEIELLTVTVDEESFLVAKDLSSYDVPEGFEIEETVYNTVEIEVFICDDIVIYVLEDEDGGFDYYTLEDGQFSPLRYKTVSGRFCIFLDMPDDLEIPYGYVLTEAEIYGYTVEVLVYDESKVSEDSSSSANDIESEESEESSESDDQARIEVKKYYTVSEDLSEETTQESEKTSDTGTSIDDMVDSTQGHYYVYCLLNGQKVLCDYDSNDNILSRCTAIFEVETEAAIEEEVAYDIVDIEEDDIDINKILLIDVLIACAVIVILIIVLIIVLVTKKKKKNDPDDIDDILFEEQDLFEDILDEDIPRAKSFYEEAEPSFEAADFEENNSAQALKETELKEAQKEEGLEDDFKEPGSDEEIIEEKIEEIPEAGNEPFLESAKEESPLQEEVKEEYSPEDVDFALDIESFFEEEIEAELGFNKEASQEEAAAAADPFEEIQKAIDSVSMPAAQEKQEGFPGEMEIDDLSDILGDEFEEV